MLRVLRDVVSFFSIDTRTPLMMIKQGDVATLDKLLKKHSLSLDYRFMSGSSLLSYAVEINQQNAKDYDNACKVIKWMLLVGIDVNQKRVKKNERSEFVEQPNSLVIYAIFACYNESLLKLLISAGGDFSKIHNSYNPDVHFAQRISPERQQPLRLEEAAEQRAKEGNYQEAISLLQKADAMLAKFAAEEQLKLVNQTDDTPLPERSHPAFIEYYQAKIEQLTEKIEQYRHPESTAHLGFSHKKTA